MMASAYFDSSAVRIAALDVVLDADLGHSPCTRGSKRDHCQLAPQGSPTQKTRQSDNRSNVSEHRKHHARRLSLQP